MTRKRSFRTVLAVFSTVAVFTLASVVNASGGDEAIPFGKSCDIQAQLRARLEELYKRSHDYEKRLQTLQEKCATQIIKICNRSSQLMDHERDILIRAAAHLDNNAVLEVFLNSFPNPRKDELNLLINYSKSRLQFCSPPVHESCLPARWQLVFEDYLARAVPISGARFLRRWDKDELETRITGLGEFIKAHAKSETGGIEAEAYKAFLDSPGLTTESISIISEQSAKKALNDVSKALSDALGHERQRMFLGHLESILRREGLPLPELSWNDFKTGRMIAIFDFQKSDPRRFAAAVNHAAEQADGEFEFMIESQYPELMYITGMFEPRRWFNTGSFHIGDDPRMNEALAAFKTRVMRTGANISDEVAQEKFVAYAQDVISSAEELQDLDTKLNHHLVSSGILQGNGVISRSTADILRKIPASVMRRLMPETLAEKSINKNNPRKYDELIGAISSVFYGIRLTNREAELVLNQWKAQNMLSIPMRTLDQMGSVPKDVAILGGDGRGGGAIDAWTKLDSIREHHFAISDASRTEDKAKAIFKALSEADANASSMIRSAPEIAEKALQEVDSSRRNKVGVGKVMVSADDLVVPLNKLRALPATQRSAFYRDYALRLSEQSLKKSLKLHSYEKPVRLGPDIVRAFIGFDKERAEAAETFLKPIEERLTQSDALGPKWRDQYSRIGVLCVNEGDGVFKLIFAGKSLNQYLQNEITKFVQSVVRDSKNVEVLFYPVKP